MKGGNSQIMIWMWYTISTWLCWSTTSIFGSSLVLPTSVDQYPMLSFTTLNATHQSYRAFILALRDHLATGEDVRHGVPVLRKSDGLPTAERFLLVELESDLATEHITLALNTTNAYVVGYRTRNDAYFFYTDNPDDVEANSHLFTDIPDHRRHMLAFSGNYDQLEKISESRERIELGIEPLNQAIKSLYHFRTGRTRLSTVARSFIVCIQMISEAARFQYIEQDISNRIRSNQTTPPDYSVIAFENSWGRLSSAVQESSQGGAFNSSIQLVKRNSKKFDVDNVRAIIGCIALMLYTCQPPPPSSEFPLLIKSVILLYDDGVCEVPEPTVRITGRNGLCVEVIYKSSYYANEIQLSQCNSSKDASQLWTLKRDGTIQSHGMCLTANTGDYVVLYKCMPTDTNSIHWQVWDNGTIINPKSSRVLTAKSGNIGQRLTVETNVYAASQSWLPSNETQPLVTSIVGLNDLCLEAKGNKIWLEECVSGKAEQAWALYGDGSIRPRDNRYRCLTSNTDVQGYNVRILSCSPASSGQRWVFKNDNTLWNLNYKMVMEVKDSNPSLKQIVISIFTGDSNQEWFPLL